MKNFNKKNLLFIIGILIPIFIEKYVYPNSLFSVDRFMIFTFIFEFIISHFVFDIRKMWDLIFKYRYLIGIVLLVYCVFNGYHLSSLGIYNNVVEPNVNINSGTPILGKERGIRSDEWMVNSMHILSQGTGENNYNDYNSTMMGTGTYVNFYPKLPTRSLSILTKPEYIGFCFLPSEQAFSFFWFSVLLFTFFSCFEFFRLITKDNRLWSLVGALLITFSPGLQWWDQQILIPAGFTAILCINKYLSEESIKKKIILSILVGWMGAIYFAVLYPAFMIPYFYFYLGLFIWLLIIHKGKYKTWDIVLLITIVGIVMAALILPSYLDSQQIFTLMSNTVYPGARFSTGGFGWESSFNYVISTFLPFINSLNASESSQFMSFYPIPIILGAKYIYENIKRKKIDLLLIILTAVPIILNVWAYIKLPDFLAKISFLYMSTPSRTQLIVGFTCVVLLVYCLSNYMNSAKEKYLNFILAIVIAAFAVYVDKNLYNISDKVICVSIVLFTILNYLLLLNSEKVNKKLAIVLSIFVLINGVAVHPISKGLGVVFNKPVAKQIQKIVKNDGEAYWISVSDSMIFSNYTLANGAKIINSTNYFPNYDVWDVLDEEGQYEEIWNRYAHMVVLLTNDDTSVELIQADVIKLNLNVSNVCKLNIKYMISNYSNLEDYTNDEVIIDNIYSNDNMYIYMNKCS